MVVEWSVLSAELPTNVPSAKTAAQRTCRTTGTAASQLRPSWPPGLSSLQIQLSSVQFHEYSLPRPTRGDRSEVGGQKEGSLWPQLEGLVTGCTGGNFWDQKTKPGTTSPISD